MGIGKRLLDLARANLNALLDRAADADGLGRLSDEDLEEELERRRLRRLREEEERRRRQAAERAAAQRAAERAAERRAQRTGTGASSAAAASAEADAKRRAEEQRRAGARTSGGGSKATSEKRLRELYEQLEVPYGASFEDVKRSFRRLMRKYHPDLHAGDPVKHQAATELTMSLTEAYRELERRLGGR
jgi:transposase